MFNALTENAAAQTANFPFCTIEPNVGIVAVPDERLKVLSQISSSENIIPAFVEIVDSWFSKRCFRGPGTREQISLKYT